MRQLVSRLDEERARRRREPPGAEGIYQDMADEQMTKSLVEGGTFGLAGTMYGQLASTLGAIAPVTGDGSATTPPSGGAIAGGAAA